MPQLPDPHRGWENEHLARYLLSRVSFVAAPLTVGDDVGVDIMCTLFQPVRMQTPKPHTQLYPRSAFVVQLKSSGGRIRLTAAKADYFNYLELPFFVGVIDRPSATLYLYSGELLPAFFKAVPACDVTFALTNKPLDPKVMSHWTKNRAGTYVIPFPLIAKLSFSDDESACGAVRQILAKKIAQMLENIAAGISQEYVFRYDGFVRILAGPNSRNSFRTNFDLRLIEVFYNMAQIAKGGGELRRLAEFRVYEQCYLGLKKEGCIDGALVHMLDALYEDCRRAFNATGESAKS